MLVTQNADAGRAALNDDTFQGVTLGDTLVEIRAANPDFPAGGRRQGETTIIVWRDCEWVFGSGGELVEIRPGTGVRTLDGLGVGSTVRQFDELYGPPVEDDKSGPRVLLYAPDPESTTGYRVEADGTGDDARITRITVCRCAPGKSSTGGGPERTVLTPVTSSGQTTAGWLKDTTALGAHALIDARRARAPVETVVDDAGHRSRVARVVAAGPGSGDFVLCVTDPFEKVVTVSAPTKPLPAAPRKAADPIPFGLVLEDGTKCVYAAIRGMSPPNSTAPDAQVRYSCGGEGSDALYTWAAPSAFPIERGSRWTVRVGPFGNTPLAEKAVTEVVFIGLGN
ncbi:hypothetical protein [Gordonia paraffinivorans]|uniref:hypothetical protein n=1 Tax=Gordonia paraffinivorans TaxID=175628 RepID=UPI0012FB41F3|nr:hypothetical protein [Gordonia paraffinivorans]